MTQNIGTLQNPKRRYHRIDGWRGYYVPACAILGSSDTGTWEDSPCNSDDVLAEINLFRKQVLRPNGIKSRSVFGTSSNIFCAKRWLVVDKSDFEKASKLALDWLEENSFTTDYVHSADQKVYFNESESE